MAHFQVNEKCNGCLACVQNCPAGALGFEDRGNQRVLLHNMTLCARCGNCWRICPQKAIEFEHLLQGPWDEVSSLDLVRCSVCGEPVFTRSFQRTLSDRLHEEVGALCPRHRSGLALTAWFRALSGRDVQEGMQK